jgi:hypothetical protein
MHSKYESEILKGRYNLKDRDVDGSTILKWKLKKWDARVWTQFS